MSEKSLHLHVFNHELALLISLRLSIGDVFISGLERSSLLVTGRNSMKE